MLVARFSMKALSDTVVDHSLGVDIGSKCGGFMNPFGALKMT